LDVNYRGSGDNGESCDISVLIDTSCVKPTQRSSWGVLIYTDEERKQVSVLREEAVALTATYLNDELSEWLDETCWSIAYNQHPGFEINDGGWGTITVMRDDVGEMKMSLNHTQMPATEYDTVVLN
jgi:hypothetical protein